MLPEPESGNKISNMEYLTLNNGVKMPKVGLGTFQIPQNRIVEVLGSAYVMGYRSFDTALLYNTERGIAEALRVNGIDRQDVFITTKISGLELYWFSYHYGKRRIFNVRSFKSARSLIERSFDNLGTDYVDLFLVHWPYPVFCEIYKTLSVLYKEGRIRAIGVCSFLLPHLEALKEVSDIVPAVNQIEISPLNTQKQLIKYCQEKGIAVEAMSTFSHYRSTKTRSEIMDNTVLKAIACKYDKSVAQIVLRWLVQQKVAVIPKSASSGHLRENISIFDFELADEDMRQIDLLDKGKFLNYNPYVTLRTLPKPYRNWAGF